MDELADERHAAIHRPGHAGRVTLRLKREGDAIVGGYRLAHQEPHGDLGWSRRAKDLEAAGPGHSALEGVDRAGSVRGAAVASFDAWILLVERVPGVE